MISVALFLFQTVCCNDKINLMISSDFSFLCLKRWWPQKYTLLQRFYSSSQKQNPKVNSEKRVFLLFSYSKIHKVLITCRSHMLKTWIWIDYSLLKKASTCLLLSTKYSKILLSHEWILIWITKYFCKQFKQEIQIHMNKNCFIFKTKSQALCAVII